MYWQDNSSDLEPYQVPDTVFDVMFKLTGDCLPVDHAQALANAICENLQAELHTQIGIHQIRVAESGNGWLRPSDPGAPLHLSRRTRLALRVRQADYQAIAELSGSELNIGEQRLEIGECRVRKLSTISTLLSHGIACERDQPEGEFLANMASELQQLDISVVKMICGGANSIRTNSGSVFTRALMVAELSPQQSVALQQNGIGALRTIGCGLFIPHKGIDAVVSMHE
jgi:CRISPR-associated protein Cas6